MIDAASGRTAELLSALIRNACVNDGDPSSGGERRNAEVIEAVLPPGSCEMVHPDGLPDRASIVARLDGTDADAPTLLLLGHTDVVPVNPDAWTRDPFGGDVVDGEVWGRGAVDMLDQTAAMAVAFAELASRTARLRGTLIYAAVADEETGGDHGVVDLLEHRPELLRCDAVLTEAGGTVVGTARGPVIGVAVGEKGMAPTRIVVRGRAAHASTPRAGDNALVTAAEVIRRLDTARPATIIGADWRDWVDETVDSEELRARLLDPDQLWDDLVDLPDEHRVLAHACTHTTYAPTEVSGGLKDNIIPDSITLGLDVRVVPGETTADVERFLTRLLADLPVSVTIVHRTEPSRSSRQTELWAAMQRAVRRGHPGARIAPTLFTGATDGRHLRALGVPAFGFGVLSPALDPTTYWSRFHGDDERIDLESLRLSTAAWQDVALDFLA